ncbi:MAG TPA: hypothetical protein VJA23_05435 [Candidatus Nanoarchaeia archaeon]|nr:hypothetical protein [Candidatus Nanoarchaeia archaeon]
MNKRGELKTNGVLPKTTPEPQTEEYNKLLERRIISMQVEIKLRFGRIAAAFQALCQEMLERYYEKSWGYGKRYSWKALPDLVAYVQAKYGIEYRPLFEGKIITLYGGFIKSNYSEINFVPKFRLISKRLLRKVPLTKFILPQEEPEMITLYIVPMISKKELQPIYFVIGENGLGKYMSGGFAERLYKTQELVVKLASDLLRRKIVHSVPSIPKPKSTPVTGMHVKVPFLKRA